MAIELHHLSTHGLFRDATKMIDGVSKLKARIAELEKENESLKYSVATLETDLAMSQRCRKCSEEMPSADEGYFIALWEDKFPDIGYIGAEDDVIETIRDRGEGHSVEWWMPLPKAPKEDN